MFWGDLVLRPMSLNRPSGVQMSPWKPAWVLEIRTMLSACASAPMAPRVQLVAKVTRVEEVNERVIGIPAILIPSR